MNGPSNNKDQNQKDIYVDLDAIESGSEKDEPSRKKSAKKDKKPFNLFNFFYGKEGKGVDDRDLDHPRDFLYFFTMTGRHASELLTLNIMYVLGNFPIFLILLSLSRNLNKNVTAPASALFAPIYGAAAFGAGSPAASAAYGLYGTASHMTLWTPLSIGVLIAGIVLLLVTFGPVRTGVTYLLRNMVKGEPLFMWNDFWHAIRKNLKQEFALGIMDLLFGGVSAYAIWFYLSNLRLDPSFGNGLMFSLGIVVCLLWITMRFYTYQLMITFDLRMFQILKNALIFSMVGIKRNFLALLGIAAVVIVNLTILGLYLPIGMILPLMFTISFTAFIGIYAAWPKIKEIMIDPYYDEDGNPLPEPKKQN